MQGRIKNNQVNLKEENLEGKKSGTTFAPELPETDPNFLLQPGWSSPGCSFLFNSQR